MNLVLFRGGYPPVVVGPPERLAYIEALQAFQVDGDPVPYRRFMAGRLDASLSHHLDLLRRGQTR